MIESLMNQTCVWERYKGEDDYGVSSFYDPLTLKCRKETGVKQVRSDGESKLVHVRTYFLPGYFKDMVTTNDKIDGKKVDIVEHLYDASGGVAYLEVSMRE